MAEVLQRESIYLWYYVTIQFGLIFPYWVLGMTLGSTVSVFGQEKVHELFGSLQSKRLGVLGVIPASILGIASPLCMYGTIPLSASFSEKGIRDDWLAAFMMSSILLNPQLIFYSVALGETVLAVRIVSCLLCGIVAGLLIRRFYRGKCFFNFSGFSAIKSRDTDPNILLRYIKNLGRNIKATGLYFLLGIILSAVFQRYVPPKFVEGLFGDNRGFGVLMAATLGVPLYPCGGATIPLLNQWLTDGMSLGAAAAFMVSGPSMKMTNLGAIKIMLGAKQFSLYLLYAIMFALVTGLVANLAV
jgi:uncharacterized membrane protein YraQ (UPF0718 family)